jgi:hypothetical protein
MATAIGISFTQIMINLFIEVCVFVLAVFVWTEHTFFKTAVACAPEPQLLVPECPAAGSGCKRRVHVEVFSNSRNRTHTCSNTRDELPG